MNLKDSFIVSVNKMNRLLMKELDSHLRESSITGTQLFTLMALEENPDSTITELCRVLGSDRTTVSRSVTILSRYGLMKTSKDKNDSRSHIISLTSRAETILKKCKTIFERLDYDMNDVYGKSMLVPKSKGR